MGLVGCLQLKKVTDIELSSERQMTVGHRYSPSLSWPLVSWKIDLVFDSLARSS